MARSEFYKRFPAVNVPCRVHFADNCDPGLVKLLLDGSSIADFCFVAVNIDKNPGLSADASAALIRPTGDHGRNFEVRFGKTRRKTLWFDGLNYLGVINSKGSDLTDPYVLRDSCTPSGFRINGVQDSNSMERICRASRLFKDELEIEGERLLPVLEPAALPWGEEIVPIEEFKFRLLKDASEQALKPEEERRGEPEQKLRLQDIEKLTKELNQTTFFITHRALHVSERIRDFSKARKRRDFEKMAGRVFNYLNMVSLARLDNRETEYTLTFDASCQQDIDYYFLSFLPSRAGVNYGKLHEKRLVQKYTHAGNTNAAGAIVDTDSIRGERLGLGDDPVSEEDILDDLKEFMLSAERVCVALERRRFIGAENAFSVFENNFFRAYVEQWRMSPEFERFNMALPRDNSFGLGDYRTALYDFLGNEWSRLNWGYRYVYDLETAFEKIYARYRDYYGVSADEFQENLQTELDPMVLWLTDLGRDIKRDVQQAPQWADVRAAAGVNAAVLANTVEVLELNVIIGDIASRLVSSFGIDADNTRKPWIQEIIAVVAGKLAKEYGWDSSVLENLPKVWDIHHHFDEFLGEGKLKYYHKKMVQELGWTVNTKYDYRKTLARFKVQNLRFLEKTVRSYLKEFGIKSPARADVKRALQRMAEENSAAKDAYSRLLYFFGNDVSKGMDRNFADEMTALKEKYGDCVVEAVKSMFIAIETQRFSDSITQEVKDMLSEEEPEVFEALVKKFVP